MQLIFKIKKKNIEPSKNSWPFNNVQNSHLGVDNARYECNLSWAFTSNSLDTTRFTANAQVFNQIYLASDFENTFHKTYNKSHDFPFIALRLVSIKQDSDFMLLLLHTRTKFQNTLLVFVSNTNFLRQWNNQVNRWINDNAFHWFCHFICVVVVENNISKFMSAPISKLGLLLWVNKTRVVLFGGTDDPEHFHSFRTWLLMMHIKMIDSRQ